jgi:mannosyl-3-phosphoglycerate phosphatase family protein
MLATRKILFTALEGCLLDARTGSSAAAQAGIDELERRAVPWVIFSGLTRAEMDPIRRKLGHSGPFVTEHGGGLFVPQGYFPVRIEGQERSGNFQMLALGKPYGETAAALEELAEEAGVSVVGVSQMNLRETERNTGFTQREAEQFRLRDFEEPFFFAGASDGEIARFVALAKKKGYHAKPGTPFWHFSSLPDAGAAARRLAQLYRASAPARRQSQIVAIGEGSEDAGMLSAADRGILLTAGDAADQSENSGASRRFEQAQISDAYGWSEVVLEVLGPG